MQMASAETAMNVSSITASRLHTMYFLMFSTITADVVSASSPDSVVASPYEGMRYGRTLIMNMPNPKPVVLCTKLAPAARMAMYRVASFMSANLRFFATLRPDFTTNSGCLQRIGSFYDIAVCRWQTAFLLTYLCCPKLVDSGYEI